jgi:hypothetical protein
MIFLDGQPIARFDPNHPSLRAVELIYKWQPVQSQDLTQGLYTMFILTLLLMIGLSFLVALSYDRDNIGKYLIQTKDSTPKH